MKKIEFFSKVVKALAEIKIIFSIDDFTGCFFKITIQLDIKISR